MRLPGENSTVSESAAILAYSLADDAPFRRRGARDETGAILILVLIFFVVVAVLAGSLAGWAINDLNNVAAFKSTGSQLYAAGGATEVAIRATRYTYPTCLTGSVISCGYVCPPSSTPLDINGYFVQEWCAVTADQATTTRQVVLTACLMPSQSATLSGLCQINGSTQTNGTQVLTLLTATVDFYDIPANPNPATQYCSSTSNESTCGLGMSVISWVSH